MEVHPADEDMPRESAAGDRREMRKECVRPVDVATDLVPVFLCPLSLCAGCGAASPLRAPGIPEVKCGRWSRRGKTRLGPFRHCPSESLTTSHQRHANCLDWIPSRHHHPHRSRRDNPSCIDLRCRSFSPSSFRRPNRPLARATSTRTLRTRMADQARQPHHTRRRHHVRPERQSSLAAVLRPSGQWQSFLSLRR